jgi:hypothetical protein
VMWRESGGGGEGAPRPHSLLISLPSPGYARTQPKTHTALCYLSTPKVADDIIFIVFLTNSAYLDYYKIARRFYSRKINLSCFF